MKVINNVVIYNKCREAFIKALAALGLTDLVDTPKDSEPVETPACKFLVATGDVTLPFILSPTVEASRTTVILGNRDIHAILCELTYRFWLYCDVSETEVIEWLYGAVDRTFNRCKVNPAFADSLDQLEILEVMTPHARRETLGVYLSVVLSSVFYDDLKARIEELNTDE